MLEDDVDASWLAGGELEDPTAIVEEVQRWNRQRQVVIHCIGLGIDSDLLKRLAATPGASYQYVK